MRNKLAQYSSDCLANLSRHGLNGNTSNSRGNDLLHLRHDDETQDLLDVRRQCGRDEAEHSFLASNSGRILHVAVILDMLVEIGELLPKLARNSLLDFLELSVEPITRNANSNSLRISMGWMYVGLAWRARRSVGSLHRVCSRRVGPLRNGCGGGFGRRIIA